MRPLKCYGSTLMEYRNGRWVKAAMQPREKTPEACEQLRATLYSNYEDYRHSRKRK